MSDPAAILKSQLSGADDVIDKLTVDEAQLLVELIARRKKANRSSLDGSLDEVLRVLPRLIRIPVRKIVFGR